MVRIEIDAESLLAIITALRGGRGATRRRPRVEAATSVAPTNGRRRRPRAVDEPSTAGERVEAAGGLHLPLPGRRPRRGGS